MGGNMSTWSNSWSAYFSEVVKRKNMRKYLWPTSTIALYCQFTEEMPPSITDEGQSLCTLSPPCSHSSGQTNHCKELRRGDQYVRLWLPSHILCCMDSATYRSRTKKSPLSIRRTLRAEALRTIRRWDTGWRSCWGLWWPAGSPRTLKSLFSFESCINW